MKPSTDEPKIVIVCALREEFAAVEAGLGADYRERFELIRAGVGPVSAAGVDPSRTRVSVLRTVSDAVTDELPAEVGQFLNEQGDVRVGNITRFIVKRPSNIMRLMELKKRSDIAAKALLVAWNAIRDLK